MNTFTILVLISALYLVQCYDEEIGSESINKDYLGNADSKAQLRLNNAQSPKLKTNDEDEIQEQEENIDEGEPKQNKGNTNEENNKNYQEKRAQDKTGTPGRAVRPKQAVRQTSFRGNDYPRKPALRIRGGNVTTFLNSPYVAAVLINGRLWCAGAIVDENWVITAAHCLNYVLHISPMKSLDDYVKVRVGSDHPYRSGFLIGVAGAIRHPKFEEEPVPHADVALLKLNKNLPFSKYVNLIKIYDGSVQPYAQSFVVVAGWGAKRGSVTAFQDPVTELLTARLKVRTQHYCVDAYQLVNGFQFTRDFFCASLRKGARDACLFDAGAPAIQQNRLVGIMSFGPEHCGDKNQPAVFIKAFYFKDFVKHTIASYKTTKDLLDAMKEVPDDELPTVAPRHSHLRSVKSSDTQPAKPDEVDEAASPSPPPGPPPQ